MELRKPLRWSRLTAALRLAAVPFSHWRSLHTDIDWAAQRGPGRLRSISPWWKSHRSALSLRAGKMAAVSADTTGRRGRIVPIREYITRVCMSHLCAPHGRWPRRARWSGSPTKLLIIESYRLLKCNFNMSQLAIPFALCNQNLNNSKFWCIVAILSQIMTIVCLVLYNL